METLEFFYDVGSPYSYLASARVDAVGQELGLDVQWRPFLLGAVFKASGNVAPAMNPVKAKWMMSDLARQSAMLNLQLTLPASFPTNTLGAQRALVAVLAQGGQGAVRDATRALFEAYWGRGEDIGDPQVRASALADAGFNADAVERDASTPEVKEALRDATDAAISRGAFGAPTLYARGKMYFGSDRFELLRYDISKGK